MLTIRLEAGKLYVKEYSHDKKRVDTQQFYVSGSSGLYEIKHTSDPSTANVKYSKYIQKDIASNGEVTSVDCVSNEIYLYGPSYTTREATPEEHEWIKIHHEGFANMFPKLFNTIPNPKLEHYAYY